MDETLLVERAVFPEGTVNGTTEASAKDRGVQGAGEVTLVEESSDLVSLLEAGDARADLLDDAGSVRARDHALLDRERVFALRDAVRHENALSRGGAAGAVTGTYLGNGKVTEVQRRSVDWEISYMLHGSEGMGQHTLDENLLVAQGRDGRLLVPLERIKAIFALDGPLLGS